MTSETIDRVFGLAIANVLPGAVLLYGVSFHITAIRTWFGFVAEHDTSLAGFLFAVAGSAALGVLLSAFGAFLYDRKGRQGQPKPHNNAARLQAENVYQNLINQHYCYYQCYRNTSIAIVLAAASYFTAVPFAFWPTMGWLVVLVASVLVLRWAAHDARERLEQKRDTLLRPAS